MTPELYASVMHTIHLNMLVTALNFIVGCLMLYTAFRQWKLAKLQKSIAERLIASAIPSRRADDAEGGSAVTEGSAVVADETPKPSPNHKPT